MRILEKSAEVNINKFFELLVEQAFLPAERQTGMSVLPETRRNLLILTDNFFTKKPLRK
jgi:hypothetical protein